MLFEREKDEAIEDQHEISNAHERLATIPHLETASTHGRHTLNGLALKLVVFSLCLAQFLSALDITIVATALPTIATQLKIDSASYTWIGSAYNLAGTASTPLWAKFSDIWGRKPLLLLANATFMAGSLVAGLARTGGMLLAGRTLQGLGGGGIVIMVSIIIADLFPLDVRAKYYGLSAVVWATASALGPVLGGIFTQTAGWRWCFFINLPLDAISLVLLWFILRIDTPKIGLLEGLRVFDWIGSSAIVGGTILFLCGLEGGASGLHRWNSAYTLSLLVIGITMIIFFALYETYIAKHPIVPMRIFTGRVNIASLVSASSHSVVFIAYDYFLPLYYQVVLSATPIISGIYLFALVIPLSLASTGTGLFIKRTGSYHYAAWFGCIVMTIGTGLFIDFNVEYQVWKIVIYQVIAGVGAGPLFLSPMIALQNHLKKEDMAVGTSAFTFLRSIASSISIVIGGVILQKDLGGNSLTNISSSTVDENSLDRNQTYVEALKSMWIFYTAVCGVVVVSCFAITKHVSSEVDAKDTVSEEKVVVEQSGVEESRKNEKGGCVV